jgi:methionine-rich copper-binding protein CopC
MVLIPHRLLRNAAGALLVIVLASLVLPGALFAHAELDTATPAEGSTVTEPVTEVSGTYTQRMKVDGSSLIVKDSTGATVAEGGRDASNNKLMVATPSTPLGPGSYRVEWTSNSAQDNEIARGTWEFTVAAAPTPSSTPVVTAAPTASAAQSAPPTPAPATPVPSVAPTPRPSADGSASGSGGDALLPIIVAVIVLGAGAVYLLSRRDRPTTPS